MLVEAEKRMRDAGHEGAVFRRIEMCEGGSGACGSSAVPRTATSWSAVFASYLSAAAIEAFSLDLLPGWYEDWVLIAGAVVAFMAVKGVAIYVVARLFKVETPLPAAKPELTRLADGRLEIEIGGDVYRVPARGPE